MFDKSKFLTIPQLKTAVVPTAEFGPVTIREMTLGERIEFESKKNEEGGASYTACLVVASAVDDGGNQLFDWEDAKTLDSLPASRIAPIAEKAQELNQLGGTATDESAVNNAAKNSSGAAPAGSNG